MKEEEKQRILAVRRFFAGEKPDKYLLLAWPISPLALQVDPAAF